MEQEEKIRLKKQYEEMPEEELIQRLSARETDYEEGIYELLLQEAKRRGIDERINGAKRAKIKAYSSGTIKQHPSVITAVIFIILSMDILGLIAGLFFMESDTTYSSSMVGALFWDSFFCFHLAKMKEWARKWIIVRTILGFIFTTGIFLSTPNYVALLLSIPIFCCILILLLGLGSKKKAVIVTSVYLLLLVTLVGLFVWGSVITHRTEHIIKTSPILMEQKSEAGFKVVLPSNRWRFLKKEDSLKLFGSSLENINIMIADTSGKVFGLFSGEDLSNIDKSELDMNVLLKDAKENVIGNREILKELKNEEGITIESKYIEYGIEYTFTYIYRLLPKTGVKIILWGDSAEYNKLKSEMSSIVLNIQEISRKEFLPKVTSKDIYSKNSDAVVLIRTYDKDGQLVGFASGFNIHPDGAIITNLHAILSGHYMDIKFPLHGVYEDIYITGLSNTLHDLVILKFNGKDLPFVNLENSMEIDIGDKVIVISNPEGFTNSISEGIISGLRDIESYSYYQITAPISQGSSGGAVFNEFGNIIGIATASLEVGQNLNFCIPITEVDNFEFFEEYITLDQFQEVLKELTEEQDE